ncbi:MAG: PAS domain S-box protein [Rhodocyclales bacterium]|nr:PAS domain S-box protein [Rhodocyclales bacterium]
MARQEEARAASRLSAPARVALAYVLLAGLWILVSDWLLGSLIADPKRLLVVSSWKGLGFVLVTGLMLYALLALRRAPQPGADDGTLQPLPAWVPLLVFAVLALVLGGTGNYVYRTQAAQFREHTSEQLGAIAELKAGQIEQWLVERRRDADILGASEMFAESLPKLGGPNGPSVAKRVRRSLEALRERYGLMGIELFGPGGSSVLRVGGEEVPGSVLRDTVTAVLAAGRTQLSEFDPAEAGADRVHFHLVAPIVPEGGGAGRAVGAVALTIDPERFLFSLVQSWPLPSASGESVLVRRDGDEVVFLNRLRHMDNKPLELRIPISQTTVPAVQAVLAGAGGYEGTDYRGVRAMSAFRPVPGTTWMVGAKTDLEEIMAPMEQRASLMFAIVVLAIGASALFVGFFWREQRNRYLLGHYRDQLERQALVQHFDHVVNYARDIILLMDGDGRVLDANDAALAAYGYGRDELRGLGLRELRSPEALATLERDLALAGRPGGALFETVHRRRDGSSFPVEVSERVIEVQGQPFRQAIVRDISARRAAEAEIHRLTTAYALLSETNQAIVRAVDEREIFERICRAAVVAGGYRGAWIGVFDEPVRQIRPVARAGDVGENLHSIALGDEAAPEAAGPLGAALQEGRPYVCNDVLAADTGAPCEGPGRWAGARAVAAVPFSRTDKSAGVLSLYAAAPGVFDARVVELLQEMAFDISFALEHIAREGERRAALQALQESEELFRRLVEQNVAAFFILDDDKFLYGNQRLAEIIGYPQSGIAGLPVLRTLAKEDRPAAVDSARRLLAGQAESLLLNFAVQRGDGNRIEVGAHAARAVFRGKPVIIGVAQDIGERKRAEDRIQHYVARLEEAMLTTVEAVSTMVELRDPYTAGHERRVGELAAAIGAEMGLPEETAKGLRITGYVHDIGKVRVPAEILSKPGRLSANEFAIVKEHAQNGHDILKEVQFPWPVAQVILQHHERLDGSGYPQGLKDGGIMLEARVLAVADVVESMSTHRPYRPALGLDAALGEIERNSGRLYDPDVVAACLRLFREKGYALAQ